MKLLSERITAAVAGLLMLGGSFGVALAAKGMESERGMMRHAPTYSTLHELQVRLWDSYQFLREANRHSFFNPGANAAYDAALQDTKNGRYRAANDRLDQLETDLRQFPYENVDQPRMG